MIIYLWCFTAFNAIFLVRMRLIHVRQLKLFQEHIGHVKEGAMSCLEVLGLAFDFIHDTTKHLLVAILVSVISTVVLVWALWRPARWKAYCMLIVGIALVWIGGNLTPEALAGPDGKGSPAAAAFLANDKHSIVLKTLFVIGHVYVFIATMQFLCGAVNDDFWIDVREEKERIRRERTDRLIGVLGVIRRQADADHGFRWFFQTLSGIEQRLFVGICVAFAPGTHSSDIGPVVATVRRNWETLRERYSLA